MAVHELASKRQVMQLLWQVPIAMFGLALLIAFTAETLVGTTVGAKILTLLIAALVGSVGYMVGATLSLMGISPRSLN